MDYGKLATAILNNPNSRTYLRGPKGERGETEIIVGPTGEIGPIGGVGPMGLTGPRGLKGDPGPARTVTVIIEDSSGNQLAIPVKIPPDKNIVRIPIERFERDGN